MRSCLFLVLVCLLVVPAHAEDGVPYEVTDAKRVRELVAAGDDAGLKAHANNRDVRPWLVVEELGSQGAYDDAAAFAKLTGDGLAEPLAAYVAAVRRRGGDETAHKADTALRARFAEVRTNAAAKAWDPVVEATQDLVADLPADAFVSVTHLRLLEERAFALKARGDLPLARAVFVLLAERARKLGWTDEAGYAGRGARKIELQQGFERASRLMAEHKRVEAIEAFGTLWPEARDLEQDRILHQSAHALEELGAYEQALAAFDATRALYVAWEEDRLVPHTLLEVSRVHRLLGRYEPALKAADAAIEGLDDLGDIQDEAGRRYASLLRVQAYLARGESGYQRGEDYEGALEDFKRASDLLDAAPLAKNDADKLRLEARLNTGQGMVLQQAQRNKSAYTKHETAARLFERLKDTDQTLQAKSNMADAMACLGKYAEALGLFREVLDGLGPHARPQRAAEVYERLGNLHQRLGDTRRAIASFQTALTKYKEYSCAGGQGRVRGNLGVAYRMAGEYEKALRTYEEALGELDENADNRATLLMNIGEAHDSLGDLGKARTSYVEAEKLFTKAGDAKGLSELAVNFAELIQHEGQIDDARKKLKKLPRPLRRFGAEEAAVGAQLLLARLELAAEKYDAAREAAADAVTALERATFKGLGDENGSKVRARHRAAFAIGALAARHGNNPEAAFYFLDRGRAGQLLDTLSNLDADRAGGLPKDLEEARTKAHDAVVRERQAWSDRRARGEEPDGAALDAAIEADLLVQDRIQQHLRKGKDYESGLELETVQEAIGEHEALVMYGLFQEDRGPKAQRYDEAFALVVRAEGDARIVKLGKASDLLAAAQLLSDGRVMGGWGTRGPLRQGPSTAVPDWAKEVKTLADLLVAPLKLADDVKRVIVCPPARLCYLPFGPLFARPVIYTPSGSAHAVLHEEASSIPGKGVLALGRPDYGTVSEAARAIYYDGEDLTDLKDTEVEARAVGTEPPLLGSDATEAALRAALDKKKGRWRAVHFACHGRVDPVRPTLSALALAASGEDDGFLSAAEIRNMEFNTDAVVLSACDTSRGEVVRGEGIRGLAQSFLVRGAPRVICALWKVDDEATRALMIEFYRLWNPKDGQPGLPIEEALAQAQAHVRGQEKWKGPRFWAAWVLWGLPGAKAGG